MSTERDAVCFLCDAPAHGFSDPGKPTADTTTGYFICAAGHAFSATWVTDQPAERTA